jgi:hypothetical protein
MKIQTTTHGIIDTNTLPDAQAEVTEAAEVFKAFLRARNGEFFLWFKIPGKTAWAAIDLKSIPSVLSTLEALDMGVAEASQKELGVVLLPSSVIELIKNSGKEGY